MAISKSKALNLTLFLLSTLTFAIVQSQMFPDVHDLLARSGLEPGLLPSAAGPFNFTNGLLEVHVDTDPCFVKHPSSTLQYERTVSGRLSSNLLEDVKGIQLLGASGYGFVRVTRIERINDVMEFQRLHEPIFSFLPVVEFRDVPTCIWVEDGASGVAAAS